MERNVTQLIKAEDTDERFDTWAILELFGHTVLAGRVSDFQIGEATFIRVDVPEIGQVKGFTKLYSPKAVYAITPCSEEVARLTVLEVKPRPIDVAWSYGR